MTNSNYSQANFAQAYQKNRINSASPLALVIMLYDGAVRGLETAKQAMLSGEINTQNGQIQKVQMIVIELMSSLDMSRGEEISKNLFALYNYVLNELVEANVSDKPEGIDRSLRVLAELRASWVALEVQHRSRDQQVPLAA